MTPSKHLFQSMTMNTEHPITQSLICLRGIALLGLAALFAQPVFAQSELLKNGSFNDPNNNKAFWQLEAPAEGGATFEVREGDAVPYAACVTVPAPARYSYLIKLVQPVYHAPKGSELTLTFQARGPGQASAGLRQIGGDWKVFWSQPLDLTEEWKEYSFQIPAADWPDGLRLDLGDLGGTPGEYWFSDVSLKAN